MLEYVQIKTILKLRFEIVLKSVCKRSKLIAETAFKKGFPAVEDIARSIGAGRFHQRK